MKLQWQLLLSLCLPARLLGPVCSVLFCSVLFCSAVAEDWRNEPQGAEGQELVWVHCDDLMSYATK